MRKFKKVLAKGVERKKGFSEGSYRFSGFNAKKKGTQKKKQTVN